MADRPTPDSEPRSASYSPPPNHRPGWIGDGWGASRGTQGRQNVRGGWAESRSAGPDSAPITPATGAPTTARGSAGGGLVGLLTVAFIAAALASAGTYGILAASG